MTARFFALLLLLTVAGCSDADRFITAQLTWLVNNAKESTIDLSGIGPRGWQRLCFIGPHATNAITKQTLGFDWDSEHQSSISHDDAIFLLVFTSGQRVMSFAEYPRKSGDFIGNAGSCVAPTDARFRKEVAGNGWINLVRQTSAK